MYLSALILVCLFYIKITPHSQKMMMSKVSTKQIFEIRHNLSKVLQKSNLINKNSEQLM